MRMLYTQASNHQARVVLRSRCLVAKKVPSPFDVYCLCAFARTHASDPSAKDDYRTLKKAAGQLNGHAETHPHYHNRTSSLHAKHTRAYPHVLSHARTHKRIWLNYKVTLVGPLLFFSRQAVEPEPTVLEKIGQGCKGVLAGSAGFFQVCVNVFAQ